MSTKTKLDSEKEILQKISEIKNKNELHVSDNVKFKERRLVIMDLFDIRRKNGSKFEIGFFKFGRALFNKSINEKIWFPKLVEDEEWKNTLSNDGKKLEQEYIGEDRDKKEINKYKNIRFYVFARFEDSYRFVGEFKLVKISGYSAFYERVSETVKIK